MQITIMVQRASQQGLNINPNPFQREEHISWYKLSFTIDSKILGEESWIINNKPTYEDNNNKELTIELKKPQSITLKNVEKKENEEGESDILYEIGNKKIFINGKELKIESSLAKKDEKKNILRIKGEKENSNADLQAEGSQNKKNKNKKESKELVIEEFEEIEENEKKYYKFSVTREPKYDDNKRTLEIYTGIVKIFTNVHKQNNENSYEIKDNNKTIGTIKVENKEKYIYKVTINLSEEFKKRRICQILAAIRNGLVAHSSGEDNTIVPLFMIAAPVKVPSPVFHSYIDLVMDGGNPKVIGISDCINNSWVDEGKVYIEDKETLKVDKTNVSNNLYTTWEDFLKACGLDNCNCDEAVQGDQQATEQAQQNQ